MLAGALCFKQAGCPALMLSESDSCNLHVGWLTVIVSGAVTALFNKNALSKVVVPTSYVSYVGRSWFKATYA